MTVMEVYEGSSGQATLDLYAKLEKLGPVGVVALNLFRAQKASARAKVYRRKFKGVAYEKKNWSLKLLCDALTGHAPNFGLTFGWREDPNQEYHNWVLYVDLPTGQVSFHSANALSAQRYDRPWDSSGDSASRIVQFVQRVVDRSELEYRKGTKDGESSSRLELDQQVEQVGLL